MAEAAEVTRLRSYLTDLREGFRGLPEALRVLLDLGGPLGVLVYKLDGSLSRRARESAARKPTWRQALSRRREP